LKTLPFDNKKKSGWELLRLHKCHYSFELWPELVGAPQIHLLQHPKKKKTMHEIGGGERSLFLGLLLSALEKPQLEIKEESYIIHFETLKVTFCEK
jgi:hypothetical protein